METDHYAILGVNRATSAEGIRTAYLKLAKKYHPDMNNGDKQCEDTFKRINMAYQILSDPVKRKKYDDFCAAGNTKNPTPKTAAHKNTRTSENTYRSQGFNDQSAEQRARDYKAGTSRPKGSYTTGSSQEGSTYSQGFRYDYQRYDTQSAEERAKKYESAGSKADSSDPYSAGSAKQGSASAQHKTSAGKNSSAKKQTAGNVNMNRNNKTKNSKSGPAVKQPLDQKDSIRLLFEGISRDINDFILSADKVILDLHKRLNKLSRNTREWNDLMKLMTKLTGR